MYGSLPLPVPPLRVADDPCQGEGTWRTPCRLRLETADCRFVKSGICIPEEYERFYDYTGMIGRTPSVVNRDGPVLILFVASDAILPSPLSRFSRRQLGDFVVFYSSSCAAPTHCTFSLGTMPAASVERATHGVEVGDLEVSAKTPADMAEALRKLRYCVHILAEQCPEGRSVSLAELAVLP